MDVAAELLWLAKVNKLRRAIDLSDMLKISLADASAKLDNEPTAEHIEAWRDPGIGGRNKGRRYTDKPQPARPHRRREENTVWGIIYIAVTNKLILLAIILILVLINIWPYIKAVY